MGAKGLLGQEGEAEGVWIQGGLLQTSTNRSWPSGVQSQPQKGLQQVAEVKHLPTALAVTCWSPRDVPPQRADAKSMPP